MTYSFSYLEPVCCSMSSSNCCFLTCIQVSQETGQVVWYSSLFQNFPQFVVIYTVKAFSIVNEAEVDVLLEFSCFFYDPVNADNLIYGSSSFSKSSLNIWNFSVHVLLKPSLENFEHYFASIWDECNCAIVWTFFGITLLWDWNENWPFPVLWPLLGFPNLPHTLWPKTWSCYSLRAIFPNVKLLTWQYSFIFKNLMTFVQKIKYLQTEYIQSFIIYQTCTDILLLKEIQINRQD